MKNPKQNDFYGKRKEDFLTDEALERLIAEVEAEPVLHPPKEFKKEILLQIQLKKKRKKNVQLFSYGFKVFAAAAAALTIVLIVPESIRPEESIGYVRMEETQDVTGQAQDGMKPVQNVTGQAQDGMKPVQDVTGQMQTGPEGSGKTDTDNRYPEGFGRAFSRRMDEYCSRLNRRLDQLVGMEVSVYEKEEE